MMLNDAFNAFYRLPTLIAKDADAVLGIMLMFGRWSHV